ncbi:MAG: hypothetical protein JW991_00300 [Candidatus Pacebacteria bacterium]|nr:hypothetical protein [Candidatus Paceibacterota bacterium]
MVVLKEPMGGATALVATVASCAPKGDFSERAATREAERAAAEAAKKAQENTEYLWDSDHLPVYVRPVSGVQVGGQPVLKFTGTRFDSIKGGFEGFKRGLAEKETTQQAGEGTLTATEVRGVASVLTTRDSFTDGDPGVIVWLNDLYPEVSGATIAVTEDDPENQGERRVRSSVTLDREQLDVLGEHTNFMGKWPTFFVVPDERIGEMCANALPMTADKPAWTTPNTKAKLRNPSLRIELRGQDGEPLPAREISLGLK